MSACSRLGRYRDADRRFFVLSGFLALIFLTGGGSRADIASLMILRPVSVVVIAYALAIVTRAQIKANRTAIGLAAAVVLLHLAQLIPLPPAVWQTLPGREPLVEIDGLAGLGPVWRPMTMAPTATWNSMWSLSVPIAVLLLVIQLERSRQARLLPVLIGLGMASAALGILQLFGGSGGQLYLYRVTNPGNAVGLFANRSHQAVFLACVLTMVLVWGFGRARPGFREIGIAAAGFVLLIPLILITGSRSGLMVMLVAAIAAPFMIGIQRFGRFGDPAFSRVIGWIAVAVAGMIALAFLTALFGRGLAVDRFLESNFAGDLRIAAFPTVVSMVKSYLPWGAGFGTFDQLFRMQEPRELISPSYFNHAHNDWLELALGGGLPAILLLAVTLAWLGVHVFQAFRNGTSADAALSRLGGVIIGLFVLASFSDYPLRTPSLISLAVIAIVWATSKDIYFDDSIEQERPKSI